MSWFILTLACIILWGVADILYKVSLDYNDSLSHYKSFVWIGIIMVLAGCVMSTWSNTLLDSFKMMCCILCHYTLLMLLRCLSDSRV